MLKKIIAIWKDLDNQQKATFAFFLSSIITSGISYVLTPVYTRLLTPDEYGAVSIFFTWQEIIGILAMFCLSYGIFNNGMIEFKEKREEFSFSMLALSNTITAVVFLFLFIFQSNIKKYFDLNLTVLLLMLVNFITLPAYNFWITQKKFEFKYKEVFISSILLSVIPSVSSIVLICSLNNKVYARIFGIEIASILIYLFCYFSIAKKSCFKINFHYWKYAIKFNLPLIPHYLSIYLLSNSDRVMIGQIVGKEETAYYSLAYSIASIILVMWTAVNSSFTPLLYENCSKGNFSIIKKTISTIVIFFLICCFCVILLAPEVISFISTKDYMEAIFVIPAIIGGVFFQIHYSLYASVLYFYKKPVFVMIGSVVATVTNIILNYIYISKYGYFAAGFTTLVCYFIQASIDYICLRLTVKCDLFDMKKIGLSSLVVIIISFSACYLYDYYLIRYIIFSAICFILFRYIKKMVNLKKTSGLV